MSKKQKQHTHPKQAVAKRYAHISTIVSFFATSVQFHCYRCYNILLLYDTMLLGPRAL